MNLEGRNGGWATGLPVSHPQVESVRQSVAMFRACSAGSKANKHASIATDEKNTTECIRQKKISGNFRI